MNDHGTAYYLYCLAPGSPALALREADVFVRVWDEIAVVLSEARREEFCGAAAEERLQDLAWLAPRACRHEAVVEQVMRQSSVLPARFATLFGSLDSLERFVGQHRCAIHEFFTRFGGQQEWAVKGLLDRTLASRPAQPADLSGELLPGQRYLRNKRVQAEARQEMNLRLQAACQEAARLLEQQSSAFRELKVWMGTGSEAPAEVILNWAFLLRPAAEQDFRQRVKELDQRHSASGLSFTFSGPWPPYSFAPVLEAGTP
ncbi:MAG TPA: GvpL/GvpF family gas vesicle protein [Bryobacteraceae bacterium]|nr:GvpL/GvpF family gas vesicle protein [Bryobacteraceae bacterium]